MTLDNTLGISYFRAKICEFDLLDQKASDGTEIKQIDRTLL